MYSCIKGLERLMKSTFLAVAAIALAMASGARAQSTRLDVVEFAGGPSQIVQLTGADAIAYGDDDQPLLRGARDYLLRYAADPSGRVYAWDAARQKVRISADGHPGVWLACDQLQPMSIACGVSFSVSGDGDLVIGAASRPHPPTRGSVLSGGDAVARNLPVCPADPRCPGV
jgi:hypothetical protein